MQVIKISVRNLVEFLLRLGDIDNRIATVDLDAMQAGARIHRKIQKKQGPDYKAEVSLRKRITLDGFELQVEGRADGIITRDKQITIDEIKGTGQDIEKVESPKLVHLAQAMCYAYIYGEKVFLKEEEDVEVQMTYVNLETEEVKRFKEKFTFSYLRQWFFDLIGLYEKWGKFQIEHKSKRNNSTKGIEFPYEYRKGQRDLVVSTYHTIKERKQLFIQAPTGVGKTMATLYPAVKALGEELGEKIFYLTAKTITRTVALEAMNILKEKGICTKTIVLTARDKICFLEERECNPKACPYAKGHYDRINEAIYDSITNLQVLGRKEIEEQAKKWQVCPFELSLDIALFMDVIICDYNYVFDPNAQLKRFFGEGNKGDYLFLIDEAHNLVDRARTMYSASLYKDDVLKIKRVIKEKNYRLTKALDDTNKKLLSLRKEIETYKVLEQVDDLYLSITRVLVEMDRYFEENKSQKPSEEVLAFYFTIRSFLAVYEKMDKNFIIYGYKNPDEGFLICLYCVNPATSLVEYLDKGKAAIFFSATLLPMSYFKKLLSTKKEDYAIYIPSPFKTQNRLLVTSNDVTTKYTKRGTAMYKRYATYILEISRSKRGNYLAFFPSYKFMEEVYQEFVKIADQEMEYVMQAGFMSETAREVFLENFEENRKNSLVGFCVMGGIFSEGIDLTRDKLIGSIIIGTGLPQVQLENELLKEYFNQEGENGFDYAYTFPGVNKVLQAAGRVIRTEEDRGIIALLDERFLEERNRVTFPREWQDIKMVSVKNIKNELKKFWE